MNFQIKEISKQICTQFVHKHHYSPVMPALTKHFLGCYQENELVGILTLGWGVQPKATIKKMFPNLDTKDYFEIGKMCMTDEMPKNSESQMISGVVKWLKQNKPEVSFLYTMADGIMGKCGYVYQAANFLYGGTFNTLVYMMENGEKLHPRSTKQLCKENAMKVGKDKINWLTSDFMKEKNIRKIQGVMFRYIMPLNKKAKKMMSRESNMKWTLNHPKEKDLIWYDMTERPKFQIEAPHFTYDNMKYNLKNIEKNTFSTLENFFN